MNNVIIFLLFIFVLTGCMPYEEYFEEAERAPAQITQKEISFDSIIQGKCASCHYYHQEWKSYSIYDFEKNGIIQPRNIEESNLLKRLINYGGDMPKDSGKELSAEELEIIKKSILSLVKSDLIVSLSKSNVFPGESFDIVLNLERDLEDAVALKLSNFIGAKNEIDFKIITDLPMTLKKAGEYRIRLLMLDKILENNLSSSLNINISNLEKINLSARKLSFELLSNANPSIKASSNKFSVDENAGELKIPFSLSSSQPNDVKVMVKINNLEGIDPDEFTVLSEDIIFKAGQRNQDLIIQIKDDDLFDGAQSFNISLSTPDIEIVEKNITVNIIDDEPVPTLSWGATQFFVGEGESFSEISLFVDTKFKKPQMIKLVIDGDYTNAIEGKDFELTKSFYFPANMFTKNLIGEFTHNLVEDNNIKLKLKASALDGNESKDVILFKIDDESDSSINRKDMAQTIIEAKCINCHSGKHNNMKNYDTDSKWIASNYIKPNDADNSYLLKKTRAYGGNMPPDKENKLTNNELDIIKDWINNIPVNDNPIISFENENIDILEGSSAYIKINLNKASAQDIVINLKTISSSLSASDYSIESTLLTVAAGDLSVQTLFNGLVDDEVESSEKIIYELEVQSDNANIGIQNRLNAQVLDANSNIALTDGSVKPRVGNKLFIGSFFETIFLGSDPDINLKVTKAIETQIYKNPEVFGPRCNFYEDPFRDFGNHKYTCQRQRSYYYTNSNNRETPFTMRLFEYRLITPKIIENDSVQSQSLIMETCERMVKDIDILNQFYSKYGFDGELAMTKNDIQKMFGIFNKGKELTDDELNAVNSILEANDWKSLIISNCSSPGWQLL